MKVKLFSIRLATEFCEKDEQRFNEFAESVEIINTNSTFVNAALSYWSVVCLYSEKKTAITIRREEVSEMIENFDVNQKHLFSLLKQWRFEKSSEEGIPVFMVLQNLALVGIVSSEINRVEDLLNVSGLGTVKVAKYGEDILKVIKGEWKRKI